MENARNLTAKDNLPLTIGHYLRNVGLLTDQYFERPDNYKEKNRQRIYLKDIDCPPVWEDKLREYIPNPYFYLNESTGEVGGPGAINEHIPNTAGMRKGRGIAPAGDLMSLLPNHMRAENLMCYIGHEGTYTPAHREMCATLGHNIMVEASGTVNDEGEHERPGSSIWFMTETKDRNLVAEYWLSILGHDIEVESHFAQIIALKKAPFKVYIVEQKPGDLILIPPLAPHQVWNRGTRTMKVAWNRTTVETLEMAFSEALPNARLVCRDEQYKCKAIVYYSLLKYSALVKIILEGRQQAGESALIYRYDRRMRQLQKDFKRLLILYKNILLSETFNPDIPQERPDFIPFDSNITCSYCRGNIFNRFLTCPSCKDAFATGTDEPYDICMECYVMGRSCACVSSLKWVEQWRWKDLCKSYEEWRKLHILLDGGLVDGSLYTLQEERRFLMKKPLAQICQEQLRIRPWRDYKNPKANEVDNEGDDDEEEIQVNEDGTVKKTAKKHSKKYLRTHHPCHVCLHRHPDWKMANCTKCGRYWCYGSLFRAHDLMPQTIMEDPRWVCPHCQMRCSTGACRRDPRQHPHEPKGTLLGHDTRKVADARSVESLVDFSVSNLNWLKETKEAPTQNVRLDQRREEAERAKQIEPSLDGNYVDDDDDNVLITDSRGSQIASKGDHSHIGYSPATPAGVAIDPSLLGTSEAVGPNTNDARPLFSLNDTMNSNGNGAAHVTMYADDSPYLYPDPEDGEQTASQLPCKRVVDNEAPPDEQIKRVTKKKRKLAEDSTNAADNEKNAPPPQSGALREFRKHQERKMLEEARKADRYNQAYAALKGRRKVVKLRVSPHQLAIYRARHAQPSSRFGQKNANRLQNGMVHGDANGSSITGTDANVANNTILIRSDVAVAPLAPVDPLADPLSQDTTLVTTTSGATSLPRKQPKTQFRYRVEDDDDFGARRDSRRRRTQTMTNTSGAGGTSSFTPANSKTRKPRRARYEEITISGSESDEDNENTRSSSGKSNDVDGNERRRRALLAKRRRDGDEDLPAELPDNWKDGLAGRSRGRNRPSDRKSDGGSIVGLNAVSGKTPALGLAGKKVRFSTGGSGPTTARIRPVNTAVTRKISSSGSNSVAYVEVEGDGSEDEDGEEEVVENGVNDDANGRVVRDQPLPQLDGPASPVSAYAGFAEVAVNKQAVPNRIESNANPSQTTNHPILSPHVPKAKQQQQQGILAAALNSSVKQTNDYTTPAPTKRTETELTPKSKPITQKSQNQNQSQSQSQSRLNHSHQQQKQSNSSGQTSAARAAAEENMRAKMMAAAEWGDILDDSDVDGDDNDDDHDNDGGASRRFEDEDEEEEEEEEEEEYSDSDPDGGVIPARTGVGMASKARRASVIVKV